MKKVLIVLVFIMAVMAVNAQTTTKTTVAKEKPVRAVVMVADLQKPITDNIAKDYAGYTVKEAASLTSNNVVTYEVVVVKDMTTATLVYDKDGNFVKKLPPTPVKK
jgi:flagellar basal body-associated protein FliL